MSNDLKNRKGSQRQAEKRSGAAVMTKKPSAEKKSNTAHGRSDTAGEFRTIATNVWRNIRRKALRVRRRWNHIVHEKRARNFPESERTVIQLLLEAYIPALSESLGVFIPLIVVNCIVLGRAEGFASKNGVLASAVDGLCQGLGYTVALTLICMIRELLGSGTFGGGLLNGGEGIRIIPEGYPAMYMVMPVGGFLVLGFVLAGSQYLTKYMERKNKKKEGAK